MTTTVVPSGTGMRATVTIANVAERTRAELSGRIDLVISAGGGALATLTGETVDVTLNPDGETSASFTFRLPTGSYSAMGVFRSF